MKENALLQVWIDYKMMDVGWLGLRENQHERKIVNVVNEMAEYLNISQMKKLQEVLLKEFIENEPQKRILENSEYLNMFLNAKRIEESC